MSKLRNTRNQGAALVIVLSILTILITLVLAFFSMVQTESQASSSFTESVEVRGLADIPVNLAITQLRKSTENLAPVGTETYFKTWTSQPGMIRVYGVEPEANGVRSRAVALYKLYSDDQMVVTKPGATSAASGLTTPEVASALRQDTDELASWNTKPGMFTDLNEPVPVPGNTPTYKFPIIDPRASVPGPGGYAVDGFKYSTGGQPGVPTVAGTVLATSRTDLAARLPMPVRWIYMLKDGTTITPENADQTKATFGATGGTGPTAINPIVGRIAFWTDDDSNKININTASEGSAWEIPVSTSQTDKDYAARVPAQNEFSRYLGHPATTSLSTVFQAFGTDFYVDPAATPNTTVFARLHKLSPRTPWGGTMAGTTTPGTTTTGLPAKQERLYASVEEMFFDPARQQNLSGLDPSSLELGKFFLTAHSRAPELNLYGKPRISLWPQSADLAQRNPKDKLLAFMSETTGTNTRPWYFVRDKNFKSATDPGSSQNLSDDYSVDPPARNSALFSSYFRALTGGAGGASGIEAPRPPGFGVSSFRDKYGADQRDELGTCMFDLLRWGVNSYSSVATTGWPTYTYLPDRINGNLGQSSAVPLQIEKFRGFGRWPTVTEAALVFMRIKATAAGEKDKIQPYLILETFVPTSGPASMTANIIYRIKGMDAFSAKVGSAAETKLGFAPVMDNLCNVTEGTFGELASGNAPFTGMGSQLAAGSSAKVPTPGYSGPPNLGIYPFVGKPIEIPDGATTFTFKGGAFTIRTFPGWTGTIPDESKHVQLINMSFPATAVTLKVPRLNGTYGTLDSRFNKAGGRYEPRLIADGDIVRSVEADVDAAPKGDLRMYSVVKEVPSNWFTVHKRDYADTNVERRQFLRTDLTASNGQFGPNAGALPASENWGEQSGRQSNHNTAGTLVKGFVYARGCPPAVPRGLDGAFLTTSGSKVAPGDWDNGVGVIADGPYIRKPDEGNASGSPYMSRHHFDKETGISYSPNRQIASAVAFGSMPTGVKVSTSGAPTVKPWQTLLFCPNPAARLSSPLTEPTIDDHPGFAPPRDHLMLDLFWMPITEPYAISEPLSTAGKINMNYQIAPFSHIDRTTGIRAVLKSTRLTAISPSSAGGPGTGVTTTSGGSGAYNKTGAAVYKNTDAASTHSFELRYAVNADVTLDGFKNRFQTGDVFRSASEICEIFLVPKRLNGKTYAADAPVPPTSYDQMTQWWNGSLTSVDAMELTGDNSREAPYNHLYPRLTTKSNTFTVHYRVQTLRKARSSALTEWVEGQDAVASEYRGSTTIERYLDPNDKELAAAMVGAGSFKNSWDSFYRLRVIQQKQFVP